jgi:hypothetical protein
MSQITALNNFVSSLRSIIELDEKYAAFRPDDIDLDSRITRDDFLGISSEDGENLYQTCLLRLNQAAFKIIFSICRDEGLWWEICLLDNDAHVVFYTGALWGEGLYPDLSKAEQVRYTCSNAGEVALTKILDVLATYLISQRKRTKKKT